MASNQSMDENATFGRIRRVRQRSPSFVARSLRRSIALSLTRHVYTRTHRLLNCGARSFDFRPKLKDDGTLVMHHGAVEVDHPMSDAFEEIMTWAKSKPNAEDLVHLDIWDCENQDSTGTCSDALLNLVSEKNLTVIECDELNGGITVGDIMSQTELEQGGGHIMVTFGCVQMNYNSSISCSDFGSGVDAERSTSFRRRTGLAYTCYADSSTKDVPLSRMWNYVNRTVIEGPPSDGQLYSIQILWQEDAASIAIGEAHGSSLLNDESRSNLNNLTAERIANGIIPVDRINLIEINNVCDGGSNIINAIRKKRAEM